MRPALIVDGDIEKIDDLGGKAPDAQVFVEKQRPDIGHRNQVLKVVVSARDRLNLQFQLLICGLQFFVDGLQLFLARLQFFRGRAVFLANRLHFLVGGAKLFDSGLVILPAGVKEGLGGFQLFGQRLRRVIRSEFGGAETAKIGGAHIVLARLDEENQRGGGSVLPHDGAHLQVDLGRGSIELYKDRRGDRGTLPSNALLSAVSTSSRSSGLTNSLTFGVGGPPGSCMYRPADSDKWRMR